MLIAIFLCVFVLASGFANGEELCRLPNEEVGTCKPINNCELAKRIITKKVRTFQDEKFLRDSACGFEGTMPKVCCPDSDKISCVTPDDQDGECINIKKCAHLNEKQTKPVGAADTEFVKNSVCPGPEEDSVCCGPPTEARYGEDSAKSCAESLTHLPPDPDSDCCGLDASFDNKILGGNATAIDQYPWLVVIEYIKLGELHLFCGGSLISTKYVLTAGHCVKGPILDRGTPKNVRLGEYNVTNNGPDCVPAEGGTQDCNEGMILAPIEETIPHPEYKPYSLSKHHDIALIRLKTYAPYTDFIRPVCLPKIDYTILPPNDFSLYVAGWGRYIQNVTYGIYRSSRVKQHVSVPFVSRDTCQGGVRRLRNGDKVTLFNGQICAGGIQGQDSCKGDSGGPLMYEKDRKYTVIGVVSFGPEICGQENIPGVYSNVYEYLPWIRSTIRP